MRRFLALSLVLASLLFGCCVISETDAANTDGVLLYEVNPNGDDEGISLHNYGSVTIDLKGYSVADAPSLSSGEGSLTFTKKLELSPGESITIVKDKDVEGSTFVNRHTTYEYGENGIQSDKPMNLANNGDDIYLFKDGTIIDAFCYGDKTITDESFWTGGSFKIKSGCFPVRKNVDTNTPSDWTNYKAGWTQLYFDPDYKIDALVTPFTFPESGGIPVYDALSKAKDSVYLSVYILGSENAVALLDELVKKGVDVNILLEQTMVKPVTVTHTDASIRTLIDDGANVKYIDYNGRYEFVHSKYCVIDDSTVIITSENWTKENLNGIVVENPSTGKGNRGWGAIVESTEYATYMKDVFLNDFDDSYGDVHQFSPSVKGKTLTYTPSTYTYETTTYSATITPVVSPDSSWDATLYYIDEAEYRLYSQQQSLTNSYSDISKESPIKHMADVAAGTGADTRFILCLDNDAPTNVENINSTSLIKACTMNKPYLHNKGLISDDTVFVSSVNWTDTSLTSNRESCIAIHSEDIADYFASFFEYDFERNYTYDGLTVVFSDLKTKYDAPGEIAVTAKVSQDGDFTYEWTLDGNTLSSNISRAVMDVEPGTHTITVKVTDGIAEGSKTESFEVAEKSSDDSGMGSIIEKIKPYLIPIIIVILGLLGITVKGSSGKKSKKKKSGGKKR